MQLNIAGISIMAMEWNEDGFGVPCCRCQAENATNRLSGDLPEGVAGHYCNSCHKEVCKEASEHYQKEFEKSARSLKTTLVSRKDGGWSPGEILAIAASTGEEVWYESEHPKQLVIPGHCAKGVFRALPKTLKYKMEQLVGTEKLPFLPFS